MKKVADGQNNAAMMIFPMDKTDQTLICVGTANAGDALAQGRFSSLTGSACEIFPFPFWKG